MENKKKIKKKIKKPTYIVWEVNKASVDIRKLCVAELNNELDRYTQSKTHLNEKMWVSIINQLLFDECSEELWKKLGHIVDTYHLKYI